MYPFLVTNKSFENMGKVNMFGNYINKRKISSHEEIKSTLNSGNVWSYTSTTPYVFMAW
jgi:hypothetical protein